MLSRESTVLSRGASVSLLNAILAPLDFVRLTANEVVDGICLMERIGELALLARVASRSSQLMRLARSFVAAAASETESTTAAVDVRLS